MNVGIVSGQKIHFSLNKPYLAKGEMVTGEQEVAFSEGGILWNGNQYSSLTFHPQSADASFSLSDVTIGVNFHWERRETQTFLGTLHFVVESDKICAINELPVERYLESVISSEMSATSSLELLKAHAVISRSWLLAQMKKRREVAESGNNSSPLSRKTTDSYAGTTARTTPSSTSAPTTTASATRASPARPATRPDRLWLPPADRYCNTTARYAMPASPSVVAASPNATVTAGRI